MGNNRILKLAGVVADYYYNYSGVDLPALRVPSGAVSKLVKYCKVFGVPDYFIKLVIRGL